MPENRIAIVGGGIGGLTLAIALQQRGIAVDVYEQADILDEVGAGVALWSNATRLLHRLGLAAQLAEYGSEPTELIFRSGLSADRIVSYPLTEGGWYRQQFGAPYYGIHRQALQRILAEAVQPGTIHLGHRLARLERTGPTTLLHFDNGATVEADLVVGADGIWSKIRTWMTDGLDHTMYSRTSGFRGVVPIESCSLLPDPTATQFWLGADKHFLHFPIGPDYRYATFLAAVEGPTVWPNPRGVRIPCTTEDAVEAFRGWHPAVLQMIEAVDHTDRWALFGLGPLPSWVRDNVVLLGDAAHGLVPHHGQGANQCVEDAVVLADLLAGDGPETLAERLEAYCRIRMDRAQRVQKISWVSNRLFHLPDGPEIPLRDATLGNLYQNVRWIHEYDAQAPHTELELAASTSDR
ncbi:FAD-dependent monooxygenase [Micromonospora zingiberis]|uniref:FAD-dependent monooxygenase n=1 Tax=Micromonospora zingiberis TaxID=2053011 RepID=A0A4R0GJ33_9ACTN|nr:NAD(P)/FAD-dependent oxidoreductase [Micromonospora zingiberis]TCB95459.1 FAD-dependent monooxygenase [Micromonospora zingiberis]